MAFSVGIDAGMETIKIVILKDGEIFFSSTTPLSVESTPLVAERELKGAAEEKGILFSDLQAVGGTGYNAIDIPFIKKEYSEVVCTALGISRLFKTVRTVLDAGAGHFMVLRCKDGKVEKIGRSDKCASGVGIALRMDANVLGIKIEDMSRLAAQSSNSIVIESTCSVFAETEIISLVHAKKKTEDIVNGVFRGMAARFYSLLLAIGIQDDIAMTGGVAKCEEIVHILHEMSGHKILVPRNPTIVGALGAASDCFERRFCLMIIAGVDVGSAGAKALIMRDENHIDWCVTPTTSDSSESAEKVMNMALRKTRLTMADIDYIVSTGYGRVNVEFAKKTVTEISCHAAGANWIFPQVRTILDVGGQDVKAIRCNGTGKVVSFLLNDRCAAGTGRYLEWADCHV